MTDTLAPGAKIGILGGGQLGRMLSVAAARLGFVTHIFEPGANPPAGHVADYVTTAAYFATRLEGAQVFDAGNPTPALGEADMKALQTKLTARGHDVGGIDGILGAKTRVAVQKEQARLGLPADAWPTRELLNRL